MPSRPKLVSSSPRQGRSPERQALAEAIEHHAELTRRRAAIENAIKTAWQEVCRADRALETANAAVVEAKEAAPAHLIAIALGEGGRPPKTVKKARAALEEAEDRLAAAEQSHEALKTQLQNAISSESFGQGRVLDAISVVVRADPAVEKLVSQYKDALRDVVNLRLALDALPAGALPKQHEFCRSVPRLLTTHITSDDKWKDCRGDQPWREALKALEHDADVELPCSS